MRHEHVEFLETALVQKQLDPFPRRQLAFAMLRGNPLLTPTKTRLRTAILKLLKNIFHGTPLFGCCQTIENVAGGWKAKSSKFAKFWKWHSAKP